MWHIRENAFAWVGLALGLIVSVSSTRPSPNVVFFLVDDQDVMLNSLDAMQKTRELFAENGLKFYNGFSVTPVCCVSRSSMLVGRYVHNHMAINNTVEGNCYSDSWISTEEPYAYNNYLHQAGYKTMYSGKYLNNYGKGAIGSGRTYKTIPVGWDEWYTLCGDAKFYNYQLSNNGVLEEHADDYETDFFPLLQKQKALSFLESMSSDEEEEESPFLLVLGTPAAHKPWTPAPEYESLVSDTSLCAPRTLSWNYVDNEDKGAVLQSLNEMDDDLIAQSDEIYRRRHAILLSVDDMISEIYDAIDAMGELDNTYFIYTADHGFHVGQFGMTFGKRLLYDTDIRVPFYVSGPGVKKNGETAAMALNIDIAPTIIDIALGNDAIPSNMDGRSLVEFFDLTDSEEEAIRNSRQAFAVEYNGEAPPYDMQVYDSPPDLVLTKKLKLSQGIDAKDAKDAKDGTGGFDQRGGARLLLEDEDEEEKEEDTDRPMNLWIMNCESQVDTLDGMNCDTWNNTFRCVRVIDGMKDDVESIESGGSDSTHWQSNMGSMVKGEMYCSYTCFDEYQVEAECLEGSTEALGEYYDLDYDVWQTKNAMGQLSNEAKDEYQSVLDEILACEGVTCRNLRSLASIYGQASFLKRAHKEMIFEDENNHVVRHMSKTSYLVVAMILVFGLVLAYVLYNRAMARLAPDHAQDRVERVERVERFKYSKVPTRPNYNSINPVPSHASHASHASCPSQAL